MRTSYFTFAPLHLRVLGHNPRRQRLVAGRTFINPMCAPTGGILRQTAIRTVGLCHSVQVCATTLLLNLDILDGFKDLHWMRRTV